MELLMRGTEQQLGQPRLSSQQLSSNWAALQRVPAHLHTVDITLHLQPVLPTQWHPPAPHAMQHQHG